MRHIIKLSKLWESITSLSSTTDEKNMKKIKKFEKPLLNYVRVVSPEAISHQLCVKLG